MDAASNHLSAQAVRTAITDALAELKTRPAGRPLTLESIAADLHCARSTVQRALARADTSFTTELRAARAFAAVQAMHHGATAAEAARRPGVSRDHLRVVLVQEYGIGPGDLRRCLTIAAVLKRWRQRPAAANSRLYWQRLRRWSAYERELKRLLAPVRPDSPLRPWADALLAASRRPDYRRGAYRKLAREQRHAERVHTETMLRDAILRRRTFLELGQTWGQRAA